MGHDFENLNVCVGNNTFFHKLKIHRAMKIDSPFFERSNFLNLEIVICSCMFGTALVYTSQFRTLVQAFSIHMATVDMHYLPLSGQPLRVTLGTSFCRST